MIIYGLRPKQLNHTGAVQSFDVPTTNTYQIIAYGVQGGANTAGGIVDGLGAEIGGDFSLTTGETLNISTEGL